MSLLLTSARDRQVNGAKRLHALAGDLAAPQLPIDGEQNASPRKVSSWLCKLEARLGLDGPLTRPSSRSLIVLGIACAIAFAASSYLGWVSLTSSKVAGCGGGKLFNCGHVISSRWSLWLGIPVSLIAAATYVSMSASLGLAAFSRTAGNDRVVRWAWFSVFVSAMSAGLAAAWFVSLQVLVLNHLCTYCLVAHACGLVAAATVLATRPLGWKAIRSAGALAALGFLALASVQLASEDPATYKIETYEAPTGSEGAIEFEAPIFEAPVSMRHRQNVFSETIIAFACNPKSLLVGLLQSPTQEPATDQQSVTKTDKTKNNPAKGVESKDAIKARRFVSLNGGAIKLDVTQWPVVGSTDSRFIFVEMFDYSCPHCRNTHAAIKEASRQLGNDMAVIALPVPLNAACNPSVQVTGPKFSESCEISKLSVAVWRVDPAAFTGFHNWMMSTENAPTHAEARAKADSLIDAEKLTAELNSEVPQKYIAQISELYRRVGSGNVPKLIFPTTSIVGEFTSGESLAQVIKQQIK